LEKPVEFHLDGSVSGEVITIHISMKHLREFFDEVEKLEVNFEAHVAGCDITIKGTLDLPVKTKQFRLDTSIKSKDLEKLNKIICSELLPFNNYSLKGKFSANDKGFFVKAEDATTGDTHFKITMDIDTSSYKPFWTVSPKSSQLRIKDLEFTGLKVENLSADNIKVSKEKEERETREEPGRHLLEIVDSPKTHFDLNLDKENFFAIDTTKVWMAVNIKINFAEENVWLSLYPRSKKDKQFVWQTPIRAEGKFPDIKLTTNPVDLTVANFSFITSPLYVPARWVFGDKVPEDASTICELLYDRD